jgi:hypothetical protein
MCLLSVMFTAIHRGIFYSSLNNLIIITYFFLFVKRVRIIFLKKFIVVYSAFCKTQNKNKYNYNLYILKICFCFCICICICFCICFCFCVDPLQNFACRLQLICRILHAVCRILHAVCNSFVEFCKSLITNH